MKKVKNVFLLALAVLTVASVSCVSGTYAKFTGSATDETTDEVRIAHFGINGLGVSSEKLNLFKTSYMNDTGDKIIENNTDEQVIVAPGASGYSDLINFVFDENSTIETNYTLSVAITSDKSGSLCSASDPNYCPIKYAIATVNDNANSEDPDTLAAIANYLTFDTLDSLNTELTSLFNNRVFAANQIPNKDVVGFRIYWKWDLEGENSAKDNQFLNDTNSLNDVTLKFNITATQSAEAATSGDSIPRE